MPMTFDEFMEAYEKQGGPLPSAWSPEAQQEYADKQALMGIAEFRPRNKNEKAIIDFLSNITKERYENYNTKDKSGKRLGTAPWNETEDELLDIKNRMIKSGIDPQEITPNLLYAEDDIYGPGLHPHPSYLIERILGKGDLSKINVIDEMRNDIRKSGYNPDELRNWHRNILEDDMGTPEIWTQFNDRMRNTPENVYHITPRRNIESIAEQGLVPGKPRTEKRWPGYEIQEGKIFLSPSDIIESGKRSTAEYIKNPAITEGWYKKWYGDEPASQLRTKFRDDMFPDAAIPNKAFQTKNPVPPTAIEIESAPGQWEPLLDYIRKRGNK